MRFIDRIGAVIIVYFKDGTQRNFFDHNRPSFGLDRRYTPSVDTKDSFVTVRDERGKTFSFPADTVREIERA